MPPRAASGSRPKRTTAKSTPKTTPKTSSKTTAKVSPKTPTETTPKSTSLASPEPTTAETTPPETTVETAPESIVKTPPETTNKPTTPETTSQETAAKTADQETTGQETADKTTGQESTGKTTVQESTDKTEVKPAIKKTIRVVKKVIKKKVPERVVNVPDASSNADKKTIRVVKKVIKKKVPKRVLKVVGTSSNAELSNPELPLDKEKPNPSVSVPIQVEKPDQSTVENVGDEAIPKKEVESCEVGGLKEGDDKGAVEVRDEEMEVSERRKRKKTEIFIGGLDKDAKEEDIRKVFEKIGEVLEVRLMMNSQTGKNKGYAFLRFASAADAKKVLTEYSKVEVCGKQCGTAPVEGKDTIFLGNIDKKWKKEDVLKLVQEIGIEKIDTVTVMTDPSNVEYNRGFAFLVLETNKDAQSAYKKLQKKDVFGKGLNIKVAWAEPLNEPDEEEMLKVKSVYVEGVPSSWDEEKLRKHFKQFGEIDKIVLARNMHSARRKDFAFVNYTSREATLACIESVNKEGLIDGGSKVNVRASLAKPVPKGKQTKGSSRSISNDNSKEKPKAVQRDTKLNASSNRGKSQGAYGYSRGDNRTSTTVELLQVLREQATWRPGQIGSIDQDYANSLPGGKRLFSALGDDVHYSDPRAYPRARLDSFPLASSSYSALSQGVGGTSLPHYQPLIAGPTSGSLYRSADYSSYLQTRQGAAPYGSGLYRRY